VAFAETLKVGSDEQIEAGAKQLARRLGDKLLGPAPASASQAAASSEVLGDFDAAQVKDGAQAAARSCPCHRRSCWKPSRPENMRKRWPCGVSA